MQDKGTRFWARMIDKMNRSRDVEAQVSEFLQELCTFLGFGVGFVYRADHTGMLWLNDSIMCYEGDAPPASIAPDETLVRQLIEAATVSFRGGPSQDAPLEKAMADMFHARSMDLIPITTPDDALIGLVGIADRRGKLRVADDDTVLVHSVLGTLAMYIKSGMFMRRAQDAQQSLVDVLDNMGVDVYVNDYDTHEILYVNRSMAKPYGGMERMLGKPCWEALYEDQKGECDFCPQKKLLDENGEPTKLYSWDYQRPFDGSWFRVLSAAFKWVDGRLAHVVSSVDITENKRNEAMIRRMAEYDQLTSLPNRHKLTQDCDDLIENGDDELYVVFLDLDGFKHVNDTLGHLVGDELLRKIGEMFQESTLTRDRTYRYGGDEFVILHDPKRGGVQALVDMLKTRFDQPWAVGGTEVRCAPSVGITHYPVDDQKTSELIRKADHAMYTAKNSGDGQIRFFNQGDICPPEAYVESAPQAKA